MSGNLGSSAEIDTFNLIKWDLEVQSGRIVLDGQEKSRGQVLYATGRLVGA